jgi:regulatory protein YycI of two-component signal transduction system YycFG
MSLIHNIGTVARYEAKTLRRSWFFRLFSLGALFIFTFLNIGLFSPIGDESWELVSISSSVPLINLYLLNIAQAIVVIFLAADFLKRDKKLDTNEVLYTRSMSNLEYVIGKTWGILRLFLGLDIIILSIGLLMNVISKSMTIDYMAYVAYLLIICVPTIVFSLGLAFVLMSVIRNQAITFLLLLGFAALNMFYLWFRLGSIFDYSAFGLPVFKSDIIGFSNLSFIVNQRLLYFFLGMALVLATVLLFKRLPQSKTHRFFTIIFMIIFTVSAGVCGYNTYETYATGVREKETVIETNKKFENRNFASTTDLDIDIKHTGESIEAKASITIINDNKEPLDRYLFSLNPALNVLKITSAGRELNFKKTNHILDIDPGKILNQGDRDSLIISYQGSIMESFCYPNYSDNIKENQYRIAMLNVNKRQAFLEEKYLLLTPETHWYPVTSLNYYPSNPARIKIDFSNYSLRVKDEPGMTAVSQGKKSIVDGHSIFSPESPLTGLTLAIGNYMSDTLKVDSVEYITYHFPGHDYYKKDLSEISDTLKNLVSGIMRDLETNFSTKYPFKTLSLAEVPVQFFSYPKSSTQTRAEVQPSLVLLPEKLSTLDNAGFLKQFTRQKKRMARQNQVITDKELQVRLFNNFIRNTFISGENFRFINGVAANEPTRYRLGPSFYFFKNNFYSTEYPVINAVFESHLQKLAQQGPRGGFQEMSGMLSDNDKANLILKEISFRDLLKKNPAGDTIRTVLTVKGDWLFNLLRSKAGIEEFKEWFSQYIDKQTFKRIDIQQFNADVKDKFGFEFYPYLNEWFNGKEQPGFLFNELKVSEIIVGDRSRYQVTFIASNPEPVPGLFNVSFRTGGPGGAGRGGVQTSMSFQGGGRGGITIATQGRGMEASDISKIIFMGPNEARKVGIVLDVQPRAMFINTLFAKNIPGEINMPVNEIIKTKSSTKEFSGEEILSKIPDFSDPSEIIADNEDSSFISSKQNTVSPLKKLLKIESRRGKTYQAVSMWNIPEYWQPIVLTTYYGKYILSSVYTRAGTGDKSVSWSAMIKEPGYYDIYCYIGKSVNNTMVRGGRAGAGPGGPGGQGGAGPPGGPMGGQQGESPYKDMHYKIYHDEGIEEITLDYENADGGWNNLGRYYLSPDTAKVILTNQSAGRIVIGDAIKWVKQN